VPPNAVAVSPLRATADLISATIAKPHFVSAQLQQDLQHGGAVAVPPRHGVGRCPRLARGGLSRTGRLRVRQRTAALAGVRARLPVAASQPIRHRQPLRPILRRNCATWRGSANFPPKSDPVADLNGPSRLRAHRPECGPADRELMTMNSTAVGMAPRRSSAGSDGRSGAARLRSSFCLGWARPLS
jgi:hypothetical protein